MVAFDAAGRKPTVHHGGEPGNPLGEPVAQGGADDAEGEPEDREHDTQKMGIDQILWVRIRSSLMDRACSLVCSAL